MSTLLLDYNKQVTLANTLFFGNEKFGAHFMTENIQHQDVANMVILDTRNQLYKNTYDTLLKKGYTVLCYSFMKRSETNVDYDPFTYMKSDMSIVDFAEIVSNMANNDPLLNSFIKRMLIDFLMSYRKKHELSEFTMNKLYNAVVSGIVKDNLTKDILTDSYKTKILSDLEAVLNPYSNMDFENPLLDLSILFNKEKVALFIELDSVGKVPSLNDTILLYQMMKKGMSESLNNDLIFFLPESGKFLLNAIHDFSKLVAVAKDHVAFVMEMQSVKLLSKPVLHNIRHIVHGIAGERIILEVLNDGVIVSMETEKLYLPTAECIRY